MSTPLVVGNVMTVSRETLLNASVQDHRRSDAIYPIPSSKVGLVLPVLVLTNLAKLRNDEQSKYISLPLKKKKKVQTKF